MTDENAKDGQHMPWQDGLPTAPDVALLQQTFPELKVGDRVPYEDVEALLRLDRRSSRWKSVTDAWRRREEDAGRVIKCETNSAFYVASADQITATTYGTLRHITRAGRKQRRHLSIAKPENEAQRATIDHQASLLHAIERESKKAQMNILPKAKPSTPLPAMTPPKTGGAAQ